MTTPLGRLRLLGMLAMLAACENIEDVSITGPGRIDGRGLSRGLGAGASDLSTRAGQANKAIALKLARNVLLRDFSILRGGHMAILAAGVDNLTIDNLTINTFFRPPGGRGPREAYAVPEREAMYPEPSLFGVLPADGFYIRHAAGIQMNGIEVGFTATDTRPAFVLDDVRDMDFHDERAQKARGVTTFVLRDVDEFRVTRSPSVPDMHVKRVTRRSY